jgi:L,D-transpeptidase YcbB
VVGKPFTRTPVLTSSLTDMITYPQWTIPQSIITKEILPATKKDPGYISKKGYSLVDSKGEEVDPYFVDWSLYKKIIPFKVVQGSGDDNALGILKFNFNNKYAVYLHDTNQRYLFSRTTRALSHGCVRVQEWEKLAYYILNNDSLNARSNNFTHIDSMRKWLSQKEKHVIIVRNKLPLFIRYFTCDSKDNKVVFYDDIYSEDKRLRDRYFHDK